MFNYYSNGKNCEKPKGGSNGTTGLEEKGSTQRKSDPEHVQTDVANPSESNAHSYGGPQSQAKNNTENEMNIPDWVVNSLRSVNINLFDSCETKIE